MSFTTVPVDITGPSYQSRSKPLSSQKTQNWYPQLTDEGKANYVLMPFPGLKYLSFTKGADRGANRMTEVLYQVKGTSLYKITSDGSHYLLGTIPGSKRCIFSNDGINLFIVVPGDRVWQYSSDTNEITQVTNENITGALSVDFFNNQFIYTFADFSTVSDVGDGSEASGLNRIAEETLPDAMVRDYVFDEVIYRFGVRSTVPWYNSGVGSPPIDKLQGRLFSVGLAATHSVAHTDEAIYWLGDDFCIYRAAAGQSQRISTDAISNELRKYATVNDAIANTFTMQGQNFYAITFPSGDKTFIISESLGVNGWFEISSGVDAGAYQCNTIINCYGKNFAFDKSNGNAYELDLETYTNNGDPIQRVRVTGSINGETVGARGKRIQMSEANILMETGVGLIEGQGDNPRIMIEYSDDGGRSWSHGEWPQTGRLGQFNIEVKWFNLLSFYDRIVRISTTDPVNYTVYNATIDLRLAGK